MGRSSFRTEQNALSTSAELVAAGMIGRRAIEIKNTDASIIVYLGMTSAVTSSTGYPLAAGEAFMFEDYDGPVYAIAASGTPTVALIEW